MSEIKKIKGSNSRLDIVCDLHPRTACHKQGRVVGRLKWNGQNYCILLLWPFPGFKIGDSMLPVKGKK